MIGYYSSAIFLKAGFSEISSLGASLGWGTINFLFAIPAIYTIDTFGRRKLLLTSMLGRLTSHSPLHFHFPHATLFVKD